MSYTYNWQFQPNVETKGSLYKSITLINSRPFTNGSWILDQPNGYQEEDANAFRSRPIKHWRKQLLADPIRKGTRHISINNIETPNSTNVLTNINLNEGLITNCDLNEIYENVEIKMNIIPEKYDIITQDDLNNCYNGPVGKTLCCNPEKNIIRHLDIPIQQSKNYSYYGQYNQSKCNTYTQGLSVDKIPLNPYFDDKGYILYPNDKLIGPQSFNKKKCSSSCNTCILDNSKQNFKLHSVFKPNNAQYGIQGAVPQKNRLSRLKDQTITAGNSYYNSAIGLKEINHGACSMNSNMYYIKNKPISAPTCVY
jgi:hypothetical protein